MMQVLYQNINIMKGLAVKSIVVIPQAILKLWELKLIKTGFRKVQYDYRIIALGVCIGGLGASCTKMRLFKNGQSVLGIVSWYSPLSTARG